MHTFKPRVGLVGYGGLMSEIEAQFACFHETSQELLPTRIKSYEQSYT